MSKGISANVGGSYQQAKASYVNVNGTWTKFGGVTDAVVSNSPTKTYSSGGHTYHVFEFTASGTLNVTQSGVARVLVVGGGGGSGAGTASHYGGGGGGGGGMLDGIVFLEAASHPVTVGAAGSHPASGSGKPGTQGNDSAIGTDGKIVGFGGGFGAGQSAGSIGSVGGSGGGQYGASTNRGVTGQGYSSSQSNYIRGPNGGGAGGAGVQGSGQAEGSYGPGRFSDISGTSVEYSRGGGGGMQPKPGTQNYGNGGSAEYGNNNAFELPQQGVVIVEVKV